MLVCLPLLAALVAAAMGADDKGDIGTVIGIDLGTTYSWFVHISLQGSKVRFVSVFAFRCTMTCPCVVSSW